jgi:integrase
MASVRKRPYTHKGITKDRWVVTYTDPLTRKRVQAGTFDKKRDADVERARIEMDIEHGTHRRAASEMLFSDAWDKWFERCKERKRYGDIAGNTLANYEWSGKHLVPEFGALKLKDITSARVEAWVYKAMESLARHSVHNQYTYLIDVLDYCQRQGWIYKNPLRDQPVKVPGKVVKRTAIPTLDEIETLIQFLAGPKPDWWHIAAWRNQRISFALQAFGGLRVGEVAALKWENVDFERRRIKVVASHSAYDGMKEPKSAAGTRMIPMGRYLFDALADHSGGGQIGYVLASTRSPSRSIRGGHVSKMSNLLIAAAGIVNEAGKPRFTAHAFRHWFGSARLAIGHQLLVVCKEMGHSRPSITLDLYGHVLEEGEVFPAIWHERLARSEPGDSRIIETTADLIASEAIEHVVTTTESMVVPSRPWVPEAVRLLETGWRVSGVAKRLGLTPEALIRAFANLGMPRPAEIVRQARHDLYAKLASQGYTDLEIGRLTNTSTGTVYHWRRTSEAGLPNTRAAFKVAAPLAATKSSRLCDDDSPQAIDL